MNLHCGLDLTFCPPWWKWSVFQNKSSINYFVVHLTFLTTKKQNCLPMPLQCMKSIRSFKIWIYNFCVISAHFESFSILFFICCIMYKRNNDSFACPNKKEQNSKKNSAILKNDYKIFTGTENLQKCSKCNLLFFWKPIL